MLHSLCWRECVACASSCLLPVSISFSAVDDSPSHTLCWPRSRCVLLLQDEHEPFPPDSTVFLRRRNPNSQPGGAASKEESGAGSGHWVWAQVLRRVSETGYLVVEWDNGRGQLRSASSVARRWQLHPCWFGPSLAVSPAHGRMYVGTLEGVLVAHTGEVVGASGTLVLVTMASTAGQWARFCWLLWPAPQASGTL